MKRLKIDSLSYGGRGVGRLNGKAVFVPLCAAGDELEIELAEERRRYAIGRIRHLLTTGPGRRTPSCEVFGSCGGCQWQHLSYETQLHWKEKIFADILKRQAGVDLSVILPIVRAENEWAYRNRVQLKCHAVPGGLAIGYYRGGSHFVIDVTECPIAAPEINRALGWLRKFLPGAPRPERIPQVDIGCGDDGAVRLVLHHLEPIDWTWLESISDAAERTGLSLFLQSGRKSTLTRLCGSDDLMLKVGEPPLELAYGPGGFAQVNSTQNRRLVHAVLGAADLVGHERILDLYCGMGNFSLPLANGAGFVLGVEDYAPSIAKARQNARHNRIDNASFLAIRAETAEQLASQGPFDRVILDPPREGAAAALPLLVSLAAPKILYVSCDPMTLARDLAVLQHSGYRVRSSQPFDLFPQTYHIESLTVLDRI